MSNMQLATALLQSAQSYENKFRKGGVVPVDLMHPARVRTAPELPWPQMDPATAHTSDLSRFNQSPHTRTEASPVGLLHRSYENQASSSMHNTSPAMLGSPAYVMTAPELPFLYEDSEVADAGSAAKSRSRSHEHLSEFTQEAPSRHAMESVRNASQPAWPSGLPYPLPMESPPTVLQHPYSETKPAGNAHSPNMANGILASQTQGDSFDTVDRTKLMHHLMGMLMDGKRSQGDIAGPKDAKLMQQWVGSLVDGKNAPTNQQVPMPKFR